MKVTVAKVLGLMGKAVMYILIAAGVFLLLAERLHETPFLNFVRSLM
jgi:hypothetical protein